MNSNKQQQKKGTLKMTKKENIYNIGGISQTTKMPCQSFNLSAFFWNVGGECGSKCSGSLTI